MYIRFLKLDLFLFACSHLFVYIFKVRYDDDDDDDGTAADPLLEGGMPLPIRLAAEFPDELVATPIEDIDPYYSNKKVTYGQSFPMTLNLPFL